ncbi:MAG: RagB/SusD family nutrient uptake outer membrane protein [Odoribacter sp.]|nr:RagB/SusD family nutrient uptake outer membrane protein [Odoribacter sp.]
MKKFYLYTIIGMTVLCSSCSDFLTEYSPDQSYVRSFADLDELLADSTYMKCYQVSYDFQWDAEKSFYPYIHFMADETQLCMLGKPYGFTRSPGYMFGYYTWQKEVEKNHESTSVWEEARDWKNLYGYINVANLVLSLIDKQGTTTENDKQEVQRIKGEAYFLRGAYYFTLANLYGKPYRLASASTDLAVPLKLTEFVEDKIYERPTVQEVYEQVLEDLLSAEKLLKVIPKKSVVRAGHTAVCLLLSRVYLYMQNYGQSMTWAEECLKEQSNLVDLNGFTGDDFLYRESPELIFTMGTNCLPNNLSIYAESFCVSKELYDCFEEGDLRNGYFVAMEEGIYRYKKAGSETGRIDVSDNFAFRTAEAYLNLAEAAACLGGEHTARARQAYNILRESRIESDKFQKEESLNGKELVDAIRLERRRELCLEGHRWFDLRRYMVNDLYPFEKTLTNDYVVYEYSYTSYSYEMVLYRRYTLPPHDGAWTLPIPSEELNANYGMPDNERGIRDYESLY